jgi:enoyl-CoA hydratase/carnithine racemase
VLRLDRPPVNALSAELLRRLTSAFHEAPASGARGLVITGHGSHYCAGLDVRELLEADAESLVALLGGLLDTMHAIAASPVPVVAAMNGHSPAGGAVLALPCDRRILADGETRVGLNEVAVGLCPGPLIHALLSALVGARWAAEMLTSGAMLSCTQALEIGLVDALAPAAKVEAEAVAWLHQRLKLPTQAYTRTRQMVREPMVTLLATATGPERALTMQRFQAEWLSDEPRAVLRGLLTRASGAR